jgi:hypothetical protein
MQKANPLTVTLELEARLARARERERAARARAAQLRRSLSRAGRKLEMQRLCTLGAALAAWCECDPIQMERTRGWLSDYLARETDRAALRGTPYAVD